MTVTMAPIGGVRYQETGEGLSEGSDADRGDGHRRGGWLHRRQVGRRRPGRQLRRSWPAARRLAAERVAGAKPLGRRRPSRGGCYRRPGGSRPGRRGPVRGQAVGHRTGGRPAEAGAGRGRRGGVVPKRWSRTICCAASSARPTCWAAHATISAAIAEPGVIRTAGRCRSSCSASSTGRQHRQGRRPARRVRAQRDRRRGQRDDRAHDLGEVRLPRRAVRHDQPGPHTDRADPGQPALARLPARRDGQGRAGRPRAGHIVPVEATPGIG